MRIRRFRREIRAESGLVVQPAPVAWALVWKFADTRGISAHLVASTPALRVTPLPARPNLFGRLGSALPVGSKSKCGAR